MAFSHPTKWHSWLPVVEWWYNTSFHTSLKMTSFQALYGFPPPLIAELNLTSEEGAMSETDSVNRAAISEQIKDNMLKDQERMKTFADKKRKERQFIIRDMVYLKIQPYWHTSLSLHRCAKLHSKYYGPFRVLERI